MSVSGKAGLATATGTRFAMPMQQIVRSQLNQGAKKLQSAHDKIMVRGTASVRTRESAPSRWPQ